MTLVTIPEDRREAVEAAFETLYVDGVDRVYLGAAHKNVHTKDAELSAFEHLRLTVKTPGGSHWHIIPTPEAETLTLDVLEQAPGVVVIRVNDVPTVTVVSPRSELTAAPETPDLLLLGVRAKGLPEPYPNVRRLGLAHDNRRVNLKGLEAWAHLEGLYVLGCGTLNDVSSISALRELQYLNLGGVTALMDLKPLADLETLETLIIRQCGPSGLEPLSNLRRLDTLSLQYLWGLSDYSPLEHLSELRVLELLKNRDLVDLSFVSQLPKLEKLSLNSCAKVDDLQPLETATRLKWLSLSRLTKLEDLSPLERLVNLEKLYMARCAKVTDVSVLAQMTALHSLSLERLTALESLTAPETLNQLEWLNLQWCKALKDIEALRGATALTFADLSHCQSIPSLDPIAKAISLETLKLEGCRSLHDVDALENFSNVTELNFKNGVALTRLPPLDKLEGLESLNLQMCANLNALPDFTALTNLKTLSLTGCEKITDLECLAPLENLENLDLMLVPLIKDFRPLNPLSALRKLSIGMQAEMDIPSLGTMDRLEEFSIMGALSLSDLSPIAGMAGLKKLKLHQLFQLEDVSFVRSMPVLETFEMTGLPRLKDISPLAEHQTLQRLKLTKCGLLRKLSPLVDLPQLSTLLIEEAKPYKVVGFLETLPALTELTIPTAKLEAVANIPKLTKLTLYGDDIRTLQPLAAHDALETLDVEGCGGLPESACVCLEGLPQLKQFTGVRPPVAARTLAAAATQRGDEVTIREGMTEWKKAAKAAPTEPRLLGVLGSAAELLLPHTRARNAIMQFLNSACAHDVGDIAPLMAAACRASGSNTVRKALRTNLAQEKRPLPPEALRWLVAYLPEAPGALAAELAPTVKRQTLKALLKAAQSEEDPPAWSAQTASVLRNELDGHRSDLLPAGYPVEPEVHDEIVDALIGTPFDAIRSGIFGSLASDYTLAKDTDWRDTFHQKLCDLAFAQEDEAVSAQALADLVSGIARAADEAWTHTQLDDLLHKASLVSSDTSRLQAAVARAHTAASRWPEAEAHAVAIGRPQIRDAVLADIAQHALTHEADTGAQRAVRLFASVTDRDERLKHLTALGSHEALIADAVGYGQLITLLAEYPEAQQEVIAKAVEERPELADTAPLPNAQRDSEAWRAAVEAVAPEALDAILQHLDQIR